MEQWDNACLRNTARPSDKKHCFADDIVGDQCLGKLGERAVDGDLSFALCFCDNLDVKRDAGMPCFKLLYELWRRTNSHIEGDACAGPDILNGIRHGIAIVTVTCGQHQRVDVASVCQALANAGCCGTCSGNTGDNFERNAASVERIGFLGAASEYSGVRI